MCKRWTSKTGQGFQRVVFCLNWIPRYASITVEGNPVNFPFSYTAHLMMFLSFWFLMIFLNFWNSLIFQPKIVAEVGHISVAQEAATNTSASRSTGTWPTAGAGPRARTSPRSQTGARTSSWRRSTRSPRIPIMTRGPGSEDGWAGRGGLGEAGSGPMEHPGAMKAGQSMNQTTIGIFKIMWRTVTLNNGTMIMRIISVDTFVRNKI